MYIFNLAATYSLKLLLESRGKEQTGKAFRRLNFSNVKIAPFSFVCCFKIKKKKQAAAGSIGSIFCALIQLYSPHLSPGNQVGEGVKGAIK